MRKGKGARNEAFFQSGKGTSSTLSFSKLFKTARETGSLNLSSMQIREIPEQVFCLDAHVEEGERFWEVNSLSKLDLSHNEITHLNPEFSNLTELTSLKLRKNKISSVPAAIFLCLKLRHLDLSSNTIENFEPCRSNLCELQECLLQDNGITTFPQFLLCARELRLLDLNSNRISHIPDEICCLRNLTRLSLNGNGLEHIPDCVGASLSCLTTLDLRKNKLTHLPSFLALRSLQVLDAGENMLLTFPLISADCPLSILHLDCNRITKLDSDTLHSLCNSLCELHMHDNKLTVLCNEIGLLKHLKVLDIANNDIGDLPSSLGYMEALQRISLDGNPIRTIRRTLLSQSTMDLKTYLRTRGPPLAGQEAASDRGQSYVVGARAGGEQNFIDASVVNRLRNIDGGVLDMSGLDIHEMPEGWLSLVERSQSLESMDTSIPVFTLNLSKNKFSQFPFDLVREPRLSVKSIDLSDNRLGDVRPEEMYTTPQQYPLYPVSVVSIDVSKNTLSSSHLCELLLANRPDGASCSLARLIVDHNIISTLPQSAPGYRNLRELQLSFNRIKSLEHVDFSEFSKLEICNLGNNKINSIGRIYDVKTLKTLLLENNELESIPPELCVLQDLQCLTIHGNPQRTVRQGILQQGTDAILMALKAKLPIGYHHSPAPPRQLQASSETTVFRGRDTGHHSTGSQLHGRVNMTVTMKPRGNFEHNKTCGGSESDGGDGRMRPRWQQQQQQQQQQQEFTEAARSSGVSDMSAKINALNEKIASLEARMDDSSVTEASRYAMKKEMAMARANVKRMQREAQQRT